MDAELVDIITTSLWTATKLLAPILSVSLGIGLAIGLIQAVIQVQEPTLTFVPKLAAIAGVLALSGEWMMHQLAEHFEELMLRAPELIRL